MKYNFDEAKIVSSESLDLDTFTHTKEAIYSIPKKKIIYQGAIIRNRTKIALRLDDLGNIKTAYIIP